MSISKYFRRHRRTPAQDRQALAHLARLENDQPQPIHKTTEDFARLAVARQHGRQTAPEPWRNNKHELVRHYRGTTYAALAAIARRIAMQPVNVGVRRVVRGNVEIENVGPQHPLTRLFDEVNAIHTRYDLWFLTVAWRLLTGDAYWWKVRNGLNVPAEIWVLPSPWIKAVPSREKFIDHYVVDGVFGAEKSVQIPFEDMVQLSEPNLDWSRGGRFYGHPVLASSAAMVDIEDVMLQQLLAKLRNHAPPGLHYSTEEELTQGQVLDILDQLMAQHSAAETTGAPIVSHSGVKVSEFAQRAREMDYSKSLDVVMDYQLAVFGVPKSVIGLTREVNRATAIAAMQTFTENTLNPLMEHIGQHLTQGLAREFDENLVVWFTPVTVNDAESIRKDVDTMVKAGAVTQNEVREALHTELRPFKFGGDVPLVPGNLQPSDAAGNVEPEEEQPNDDKKTPPPATADDGDDDDQPEEKMVNRVTKYLTERRRALLNGHFRH